MNDIPLPEPPPHSPEFQEMAAKMAEALDEYVTTELPHAIESLRRLADEIQQVLPHLPRHAAECTSDGCGVGRLYEAFTAVGVGVTANLFTLRGWMEYLSATKAERLEYLRHVAAQN